MRKRSEKSQKIVEYRKKNTCLTLQAIGDKFGVTRERVRQILNRAKVQTYSNHYRSELHICPNCGGRKSGQSNLCRKCFKEQHTLSLVCATCGKIFKRCQSQVLNLLGRNGDGKFYCSYECWGKVVGERYGFAEHPENQIKSVTSHEHKHDYDFVWQKHIETKFGAVKLSRLLNIPESTVSYILSKMRSRNGVENG